MSANKQSEDDQGFPKLGEIVNELSMAMLQQLHSGSASARVLKKHWLMAQAELLKGYQEVIKMELAELDNPAPEKRTKIVVE